ncbi:glycosyltransferase family 4 protein [Laspinema sp. D1]|uniref:glycosyltransferase family 4 protein n=1 Tax=Laspinema palackyanum TaxID=3231601 RepID=UPI00349496C6|nr:glycosyltransferase family 4 protein [Laspinema sp. D2b]
MKLTLVIHSLTLGGAERVMSIMANYWVDKRWKITILTFDDGSIPPVFHLDSRVCHIPLGLAVDSINSIDAIWQNFQRVRFLRQAIIQSKPHVVISFIDTTNVMTLLATRQLNIPVVVSERTDPAFSSSRQRKIWVHLRRWTYPQANRLVVQSQGAYNYFPPQVQVITSIIPNPVLIPVLSESGEHTIRKRLSVPCIMAMGRLLEVKGFDLLLQAFAKVKDHHPQWSLTILGEGQLRSQLELLSHQLGIYGRVFMPGLANNVYEFLQQADIFVMSSRYEGFPNALCEAMACGLAVISTDCPSGPREIIRHGIDGILVENENVEALASAMDRLMSDEQERKELAAKALEVIERFSLEKVMGMWEQVLNQVIEEKL